MNSQSIRTSEPWNYQIPLNWKKCHNGTWCRLNSVNLDHEYFTKDISGVYIIWHGGTPSIKPRVVYVGQGNIEDRIRYHRKNPALEEYKPLGLYVTWARVPQEYLDRVEAYLADKWDPLVGEYHPQALPIEVNSPW